jgi:hypothetical protein
MPNTISQFTPVQAGATDYARGKYPLVFSFLTAYWEWMEQTGNPVKWITTLPEQRDIDTTVDEFVKYFEHEFLDGIPTDILTDKRKLVKHIMDFYRARGSENSFKLLFRILFNEDVEFYYPKTDILKVSDGKWVIDNIAYVSSVNGSSEYANKTITGASASAVVEKVEPVTVGTDELNKLYLCNVSGTFTANETVTISDQQETIYGIITGASISNTGTGYSEGTTINVSGENQTGSLEISVVDSLGHIKAFKVKEFGINYLTPVALDLSLTGDGNAQAEATVGCIAKVGHYLNDDGFISANKYIQDSKYYQNYSYVLKSKVSINEYRDIVKKLLHPASFALFGIQTADTPTAGRPSAGETYSE